ncbi:hypothetical protein L226DRAFT_96268 [Lentinus tigrinus ALCF2SS1-7]|uniref:uncharacterized protein n=1 Tax=Lentinus tigrinus ALCF2SS1-7 TaxID=1328758 RepID=UPI0011661378|nr:hypothetical protein L226DRAFT_96268 [Lentinus tigrinus ALCF2SS1-7]
MVCARDGYDQPGSEADAEGAPVVKGEIVLQSGGRTFTSAWSPSASQGTVYTGLPKGPLRPSRIALAGCTEGCDGYDGPGCGKGAARAQVLKRGDVALGRGAHSYLGMYLAGGRRMGSRELSYRDGVPGTGRSEARGHASTGRVCRPVIPLHSPTGTGRDARQGGRGIGGEGRPNHPPPDGSDGFVVELSSRYSGSGRGYPSLAIGCEGSQRLYGHLKLRAFVLVVRHARPEWMGVKKTG